MVFPNNYNKDGWNDIYPRMVDPIIEEQQVHSGVIDSTNEHTLIDDIDKNGYIVHDDEEIGQTGQLNDETRDFVDIDGYISHDENETDSNNLLNQSFDCYVIGKKFDDADAAYDFYNEYGLSKGFGIRKHYHKKHSGTNDIYRHIFVCNKEGFKCTKQNDNAKPRCIKRTSCKARIQVTLAEQGKWVVDKFEDEHNHPLSDPSQVPRQWSHKVFHRSKECKELVKLMSQEGIRPSAITKIVNAYKGNQEDKLTRIQCTAIVGEEKNSNLGKECHGIIMHFQEKAQVDKDFYFAMDLDTNGTFKNVFWADGRSRSSYNQFGDVVIFDVTYKTNSFSLPFAPFVWVNHHGQTILFGAALLENETEATFTWLFKKFLE